MLILIFLETNLSKSTNSVINNFKKKFNLNSFIFAGKKLFEINSSRFSISKLVFEIEFCNHLFEKFESLILGYL